MTATQQLLEQLVRVKRAGPGWSARCPAHDDRVASLSISEGDDGRALVHCHAGCDVDTVLAALNLDKKDLFPAKDRTAGLGEIVATYPYRDAAGKLVSEVVRFSSKEFRPRLPDGSWRAPKRKVPYRLPELRDAIEGRNDDFDVQHDQIIVVEGEKDVDRLAAEGYVATCNAFGAGKWTNEHSKHLRGAHHVVVVADNDDAGHDHAITVARSLRPHVPYVEVATFEGAFEDGPTPKGYDVSDFLNDKTGLTIAELPWVDWRTDSNNETGEATPPVHAEPVDEDGAQLLDDVAEFIRRYVVCTDAGITAGTLWAAHTHALDAFDVSPRFFANSKEPGSGKTRYLEVLKVLVRAALMVANISEAALFRRIDAERVTLLHDEIDAVFGRKARDREDMRALLNAGWERGATIPRCVGDGSKMAVRDHQVFTAVALAGLERLPATLEQRSIVVKLKRRKPGEPVAKFRRRQIAEESSNLRDRLAAWCAHHLNDLEQSRPELPDEMSDRAQDAWEPLLAIAEVAGGEWPDRARKAARELYGARAIDDATLGVRLLTDIHAVFEGADAETVTDDEKGDGISSGDLAKALAKIEGAPWAEWRNDKALSANALARLLVGYDIRPDQHKMAGANMRGYLRSDFTDAWERYLDSEGEDGPDPSSEKCYQGQSVTGHALQHNGGNTSPPVTHSEEGSGHQDGDEGALERLRAAFPDAVLVAECHRAEPEPAWIDGIDEAEVERC